MTGKIKTIADVADWGLCMGCGTCAYACRKGAVSMRDIEDVGILPRVNKDACESCGECLAVCPGYSVDSDLAAGVKLQKTEADRELGSSLEIWEGYAADPEIRYQASSGGMLSALALYCLEREGMAFTLHSGMDPERPWLNKTLVSRDRKDILATAGSRYAPSSPCEGLRAIEESLAPCVFIGKPCDAAGATMARMVRPELDRRLGLVLTFFCAGTPLTAATLELLESMNIAPHSINSLRYRGEGWPGGFKVKYDDGSKERFLTYEESWGKLNLNRPFRCYLCPHGLGPVADISCGDAWHAYKPDDPGRSLVIVRTPKGKEILRRAMAAGYVRLEKSDASKVIAAQPLLERRRILFGRLLAMRLLFMPIPVFRNFSLFHSWIRRPLKAQIRSFIGTLKRSIRYGHWRRRNLALGK